MRRTGKTIWLSLLLGGWLAIAQASVVGCGGEEKKGAAATPAATPRTAATPAATPADAPASALQPVLGEYRTAKLSGDVPRSARGRWTIKILADGGVEGRPTLAIYEEDHEESFTSAEPVLNGDTLTLLNQECSERSTAIGVDGAYTVKADGDTLTLALAPGSPACEDGIVEAILTTKPLRRVK
jgi:hypothetical protein